MALEQEPLTAQQHHEQELDAEKMQTLVLQNQLELWAGHSLHSCSAQELDELEAVLTSSLQRVRADKGHRYTATAKVCECP